MRRSSREIPARVCQPENPVGQARKPDRLASPHAHLRPRRRGGNAFTRYGHGGTWGTQAWIDPVRGVAYVLILHRSNFPNTDASDVRRKFPARRRKRVGRTVRFLLPPEPLNP